MDYKQTRWDAGTLQALKRPVPGPAADMGSFGRVGDQVPTHAIRHSWVAHSGDIAKRIAAWPRISGTARGSTPASKVARIGVANTVGRDLGYAIFVITPLPPSRINQYAKACFVIDAPRMAHYHKTALNLNSAVEATTTRTTT